MNGEPIDGDQAVTMVSTLDQRLHPAKIMADKLMPNAKDRPIQVALPPISAEQGRA